MAPLDQRSEKKIDLPVRRQRDLRIDFMRGLALLIIFIDHVPSNALASVTMQAFGLSDAAEAFVLIAGFSAYMAYAGTFERSGLWAGFKRVGLRIRDLYAAHLILVAVCAGGLTIAARYFENPFYFEHVNLTPFSFDPVSAIWQTLILQYQLGYVNILPLYMLLLASFGLVWWGLRRDALSTVLASVTLWFVAGEAGLNLPSWPENFGWYFNPFAWQLLFVLGAATAYLVRRDAQLPRNYWLQAIAVAYLIFGCLVAAPWMNIPDTELPRLIPLEWMGTLSKSQLSVWRVLHIVCVAYLFACIIPANAKWLSVAPARLVINCGANGLDIFCLGTVLSFIGFVVLLEGGRTWELQALVNAVGIGILLGSAWVLTRRAARQSPASLPASSGRSGLVSDAPTGPAPKL